MTEFDPYRVLGLGRTAEASAIKAAYRVKVRSAHPDRGGDAHDFMAVVKAFGLLSDPELRRIYDETGIVDAESLKAYRRDVTTVLADMFDAAVQSAVASRLKLSSVDFIALMTAAVGRGMADAQRQAADVGTQIDALAALAARIRRTDGKQNLFVDRLNAQMQAKNEQHTALRRRILVLETAGVELGNYESDVELISALEVTL